MPIYKNNISQIVKVIIALMAVIFSFSSIASAEVIETDLGVVPYTQAPKTWTIDVPQNFNKVEVAHYSSGKIEANKYMGWNGYLKFNGQYVWKFVRFDATLGGIIYDYIIGAEVRETTGRGLWLDVTSRISAGSNTITYYHYNEGPGIGVKVRIYTTATPAPTTPAPTTPAPTTPAPTTPAPTTPAPTTPVPTTPAPTTPAPTTPVPTTPALTTPAPTITVTAGPFQGEYSVLDLGVVPYTQAPKTWTIDVPQNFNKVEVAVYSSGKDEANQFGGWNAYLQLNGEYAWKFVRHDANLGGIFYDYIKGSEIQETTVKGMWFDVTGRVKAGKNTITYYHYTGGDGIGVKVRIYAVTPTQTSTIIPVPTALIITPTSTQIIPGKYTREGPATIDEQIRIQCESSDYSEISLFKISNENGYICSNNVAYKVLKVSLRTVDPHGAPIDGVEVYKQVFDKRTEIIFDIVVGMAADWALGHLKIPTKILTAMNVNDILQLPGKIKLFVEGEYLIIGKTDSNGYIEAWVKENKEIRFKGVGQIPTSIGPVVETDHSIRKVLSGYPWVGDITITASSSSPNTGNLKLRRGANVVVVYEKGKDGVSGLEKFFKEEFGIEIVKMTFETLQEGNIATRTNINNAGIIIYLLRSDDTSRFFDYGNLFMPTIKKEGFIFKQIIILDENERKYTDKSNGLVSYRIDTNSGINNYLIAGIGNEGLKSAAEAFKKGEWRIVVGPEPIQPTPAKKPWWKIW